MAPSLSLFLTDHGQPSKDAEADCTAFVAAVLETYTASRQLDAFVDDILNALPSVAYEGSHILLEKPLFRRDLLQAYVEPKKKKRKKRSFSLC